MDANVSAHSGERTVVRVVFSNIAERAPTEQQKAQREEQELHRELGRVRSELLAQRKFAEVGRLAGGIAHDFSGLLGTVLAQSELALAGLANGERPEAELQAIREAAVRGSEICRQLMIQAGKESEVLEPVDLSRTINDVAGLIRASVSKHAVVETSLGQDLPAVRANPAQLRRVVMNLVTNASDALGDRGGAISVVTSFVAATSDSPGSSRPAGGDYVQLQVSDTGCGMTPEIQARVFDPFFTTKANGHGIGLTVVQEIVHALGGDIRLASTPGRGSTFEILLPCVKHADRASGAASEETHQRRPATILFVEDEELLRQPVSKMLRKAGYSVIEAASGSAAMDRIRACGNQLDVLILDVTLPGASSLEVLDETSRLRPEMKVIVSSAFHEDMASASLTRKIGHFIRKPYRVDKLVTLISRLQAEAAAIP